MGDSLINQSEIGELPSVSLSLTKLFPNEAHQSGRFVPIAKTGDLDYCRLI